MSGDVSAAEGAGGDAEAGDKLILTQIAPQASQEQGDLDPERQGRGLRKRHVKCLADRVRKRCGRRARRRRRVHSERPRTRCRGRRGARRSASGAGSPGGGARVRPPAGLWSESKIPSFRPDSRTTSKWRIHGRESDGGGGAKARVFDGNDYLGIG